jgi:hypothetical protein
MTRIACLALAFVATLGPLASTARAQGADPFARIVVTRPAPYWGYFRYPLDAIATLDAIANYTRASGEYMIMRQEAIKAREENFLRRLKTREEEFKAGWRMYEAYLAKNEENRERIIQAEIKHSREHASVAEIISGNVLNNLLRDLQKDSISPEVSQKIKPEWLKSINFMSTTGGNSFFLRTKNIPWTAVLQEELFDETRALVEDDLEKVRAELKANKVPGKTLKSLNLRKDSLYDGIAQLSQKREKGWTDRHYIEARRQVYQLAQTVKLLDSPEEAKRLLAAPPENVRTVAELVSHMREYALTFSAAPTSATMDYVSLHAAFAAESREQAKRRAAGK